MDAKDYGEQTATKSNICSLEWIAWAIEAARRHKEDEQSQGVAVDRDDHTDPASK